MSEPIHTHHFEEVLSRDDGLTRRCQCGARLWEPAQWPVPKPVLRFKGGDVVKIGGRLVFQKHPQLPNTIE